mmetsp:Transcript_11145/g.18208  ORF Transcript_11145/g.18208 Transcript_11145/m.18208 type:complete len:116 (+) Transcript_11145:38-385(+)|eukprot:CAMPEP_0203772230 /NCGR_PEP_ID=MMETSP0099_2-20121227/3902_1 /ASSEMBLY_ACC=CAM_ASM_000209 /TAXON_ID=96639 /ORGANISM=" , Strain NY0313808BC1" /LENGTH=115 /DNA_ID=CAMNT_0050669757 /DNA_START=44 /DNA_END=391 /DNA_ORIENTATION=+
MDGDGFAVEKAKDASVGTIQRFTRVGVSGRSKKSASLDAAKPRVAFVEDEVSLSAQLPVQSRAKKPAAKRKPKPQQVVVAPKRAKMPAPPQSDRSPPAKRDELKDEIEYLSAFFS